MSDKIYETACIYKIESADGSKVYYGSTCDFKKRMSAHKADYKRYLAGIFNYMTSFEIIKNPGYTSAIIEEFTKITKRDLEAKESEYIQKNNCVNKMKLLTDKEKEKYQENYRKLNKSKISEQFSCACGGHFTRQHKSCHEQSKKHQSYIKSLQPIVHNITNINYYITKSGVKIFIKK
jgi:hypothetical protein